MREIRSFGSFGFFDCYRATSVQAEVKQDKQGIILDGIVMPHLRSYDTMPSCSSDVDVDEDSRSVSSMTDGSYLDESTNVSPLTIDAPADKEVEPVISFDSKSLRQLKMPKPIPKKLSEVDSLEERASFSTGGC